MKNLVRKLAELLLKLFGTNLLSREQTRIFLESSQLAVYPENTIFLPELKNAASSNETIFPGREVKTDPAHVWQYLPGKLRSKQSSYGLIKICRKLLCTDFSHSGFYKGLLSPGKRSSLSVHTLIAPWSHYLDGIAFGGYYDFVFLVAAKLCRIKDNLSEEEFLKATVAYPLFDTQYEAEYLELIGIQSPKLVDSRSVKISFEQVVLANSGNWSYPNVADILSLKKHIEARVKPVRSQKVRTYISRKGRRCVRNEEELVAMLKKFEFTIIEDKARSVSEQVSIYQNASFILGPHGASFTNIIWCDPGTHLLELFAPNYIPEFFQYLAVVMEMDYTAYYHGTIEKNQVVKNTLVEDLDVDVKELEKILKRIFAASFPIL